MNVNLPIYEAKIDENPENGMFVISLVDCPAVERNFIAFSKENKLLTYQIANEEQRKVFGLVMAANFPIYRCDYDGYEYYVQYSKETIAQMAEKWLKHNNQNNVDTNHNFKLENDINLTQVFMKNSAMGISPVGYEDVEDGSLFAEYKVNNDEVWEAIKRGEYKGFSLAGVFALEPVNKANPLEDDILDLLNKIEQKLHNKNE